MKPRMNVTKAEAKQIGLWGVCILNKDYDHLMITKEGKFIFEYFAGSDQDILYYEDEYKDYEWRLIENKRLLNRGDVVKVEEYPNKWSVAVFDNLFDDRFNFWRIRKNRPNDFYVFNEQIYKLYKKSDKK